MNFRSILKGELKGKYIRNVHLPISIISLIICFILAGSNYDEFNFLNHDISYLGNVNLNPNGFFFWSIGMAFAGFMILLLIPSLFMRLNEKENPNRRVQMQKMRQDSLSLPRPLSRVQEPRVRENRTARQCEITHLHPNFQSALGL
mgnify:CR=1 FL=1